MKVQFFLFNISHTVVSASSPAGPRAAGNILFMCLNFRERFQDTLSSYHLTEKQPRNIYDPQALY